MLARCPCIGIERLPEDLVAPAMVAAFDGWVDAASAASTTAEHLAQGGELVAAFDADVLYDYRSRRPVLDIIDGTLTRLIWPSLELHRVRSGERDLLILHGAEPDFRWRELGDEIVELALRLGVVEWVSLGVDPRGRSPHARRDGDGLRVGGRSLGPLRGTGARGSVARPERVPLGGRALGDRAAESRASGSTRRSRTTSVDPSPPPRPPSSPTSRGT